ncbi:MAG TPA: hypothetical protein VFA43_00515 [Gemmatimonadaceae bacterium]|nr:hypothetical protein [Gemmatimonadaceae bacterium]
MNLSVVLRELVIKLPSARKLGRVVQQPAADFTRFLIGSDRAAAPGTRRFNADVPAEERGL